MPGGFWKYAQEDPGALAVVDPDGTEYSAGDAAGPVQPHGPRVPGARTRARRRGRGGPAERVEPGHVYLAALQAGLYYVPINYRLSPPEIAYILAGLRREGVRQPRALRRGRRARPPTRPGSRPRDRLAHRRRPGLPVVRRVPRRPARPRCPRTASTGAAMHYTSGTTGQAEGREAPARRPRPRHVAPSCSRSCSAVRHHAARRQRAPVHVAELPHRGHDVRGQLAAHGAHRRVHGQVGSGGGAAAHRALQAARTRTWSRRSSSACCSSPTTCKPKYDVSSMKWAIHAAAPCPVDVKRKMLDWWGPVIWEYYARDRRRRHASRRPTSG